ncbi:hypothetical protein Ciccas_001862 [Cichlidogyrus casuarinus]|uniref:BHLH domain-containing protein n=1 Tax=Cichlidogyrus casuarinus TaxID=1844966 RepID=A0ABD2QIV0_9PLAT
MDLELSNNGFAEEFNLSPVAILSSDSELDDEMPSASTNHVDSRMDRRKLKPQDVDNQRSHAKATVLTRRIRQNLRRLTNYENLSVRSRLTHLSEISAYLKDLQRFLNSLEAAPSEQKETDKTSKLKKPEGTAQLPLIDVNSTPEASALDKEALMVLAAQATNNMTKQTPPKCVNQVQFLDLFKQFQSPSSQQNNQLQVYSAAMPAPQFIPVPAQPNVFLSNGNIICPATSNSGFVFAPQLDTNQKAISVISSTTPTAIPFGTSAPMLIIKKPDHSEPLKTGTTVSVSQLTSPPKTNIVLKSAPALTPPSAVTSTPTSLSPCKENQEPPQNVSHFT